MTENMDIDSFVRTSSIHFYANQNVARPPTASQVRSSMLLSGLMSRYAQKHCVDTFAIEKQGVECVETTSVPHDTNSATLGLEPIAQNAQNVAFVLCVALAFKRQQMRAIRMYPCE